jgi:protein SCO1/2
MNAPRAALAGFLAALLLAGPALALHPDIQQQAIAQSQAALGNRISDMAFTDSRGQPRRLTEFQGRPVAISLIFTACVHACSVTTRHIDRMVRIARAAVGEDSFTVLTIGFDIPVDSPEALRAYASRHGINDPNWHFLSSGDAGAMARLMEELGFTAVASPRGFDHTVQLSILDRDGVLHRQVYGELFPTPQLVEPLKDLVWGRPTGEEGLLARVSDRVRLFCTVYDPKSDRYYFDYSLFAGIFIGVVFIGGVSLWLLFEVLRTRRRRAA